VALYERAYEIEAQEEKEKREKAKELAEAIRQARLAGVLVF